MLSRTACAIAKTCMHKLHLKKSGSVGASDVTTLVDTAVNTSVDTAVNKAVDTAVNKTVDTAVGEGLCALACATYGNLP